MRHAMRPDWGVGRVIDVYAGLTRVQFADGVAREFRADVLEPVAEADAPEALRALTPAAPAPAPAPKPASRARKPRAT